MQQQRRCSEVEVLEPRRLLSATFADLQPQGLTPQEVRHAYGFDSVQFSANGKTVAGDGSGQTIAIVTAFDAPTIRKDLRLFDQMYGLPDRVRGGAFALNVVKPQGKTLTNNSWAQETSLDVQWAHAIAPGAKILLVEAKSDQPADLFNAVNYARRRKGVSVVSMSWGWDTAPAVNYGDILTTPRKQAGKFSQGDGITFVEAAADDGKSTAWPDASVNVVSVGGTTLTLDANANYVSETALPQSASAARVSYNADPAPGYSVYDSTPFDGTQGWQVGAGTSAGAPQWAALFAIANQGRALAGKHSLDGATQTLPALDSLPASDFHTITTPAPSSGRGSPFADRIIRDLTAV